MLKTEDKLTPSVTVNNEGPNSRIESQVDTWKAQDTKNIMESSKRSVEKQVIIYLTKDTGSEIKSNSLEQEWDQFNKKYKTLLRQ